MRLTAMGSGTRCWSRLRGGPVVMVVFGPDVFWEKK
jgi:hypothetical protein